MSTELHRWRKGATTDEWAQLAKLANTTPGYLDHGNRRASPEMASAIEDATKKFHRQDPVLKESLVFASPRNTAA